MFGACLLLMNYNFIPIGARVAKDIYQLALLFVRKANGIHKLFMTFFASNFVAKVFVFRPAQGSPAENLLH